MMNGGVMRKNGLITSVVVVVGWSAMAAAQTLSPSPTNNGDSGSNASMALAQQPTTRQVAHTGIDTNDHWFASAYLGPNFGSGGSAALTNPNTGTTITGFESGRDLSINFGGEVGYAFAGWIGAEFMANWAPNFQLTDALLSRQPSVSAYMGNALFVVPTSGEHRFSPFVSGGVGAIHLNSTVFTVVPGASTANINLLTTENVGGTQFGWDLGGGVFAFSGPWGL